jgi:hydroxymethylpyrimidine pyrophosphatase-like HAD family hydrolase
MLAEVLQILYMQLKPEHFTCLDGFLNKSRFITNGAVITDLDGTAVHEWEGRTMIHQSVEYGLKKLYSLGRPVVINTLRFPLSVIRTFGKEWYKISNMAIPVVLLNGSQLGLINKTEDQFNFTHLASFPLHTDEIRKTISGVRELVEGGIKDLVLFYYPDDWTKGEVIWTPIAGKIPFLQNKYKSASSVISVSLNELETLLHEGPVCMIFLLIEVPGDRLMAYQHTQRNNFITRKGVDKRFGMDRIAAILDFDPADSIGAGDSPMDTFLGGVGLSVHVGNMNLPFKGLHDTIRVESFFEFGDLLYRCADRQKVETK